MPKSPSGQHHGRRRTCPWALWLLLPLLMGGCPEVRNEIVSALDTTTRDVVDVALNTFFEDLKGDRF